MSELAKRVRAARSYAGLRQRDLAAKLGLDVQAVKRTEAGRRDPKPPEQWAIADACGLPREFFTVDFERLPEISAPAGEDESIAATMAGDPLVALDTKVDELTSLLARVLRMTRLLDRDGNVIEIDPGLGADDEPPLDEIVERFRRDVSRIVHDDEPEAAPPPSSKQSPGTAAQDPPEGRPRRPA